jgi:hypothetical protein
MDKQETIDAMAAAIRECTASWERGESASPDERDMIYAAQRAVGIGTAHGDIDDAFVDETYEWEIANTPGPRELAEYLYERFFGED